MKSISLFMLFLLAGICSSAQYRDNKIKVGVKAGFNMSLFTRNVALFDEPDPAYSNFRRSVRGSFTGGFTVDFKMAKGFSLGTELLFNSRGMSYQEENDRLIGQDEYGNDKTIYNYYNYNIDYLELPVILNYNFKPESSRSVLIAYVGLAQSVLVNHKTKLDYPRKDREHSDVKAELNDVHNFNKSVLAGLQIGSKELMGLEPYIDFRGNYTLSPVFNRPVNEEGQNLKTRMLTFTLAFGVKF